MLGTALRETLMDTAWEVFATDIVTDQDDVELLDVRIAEHVDSWFDRTSPGIVFHLAAETDVDLCERDPEHAYNVHVIGTQHVVDACSRSGCLMVYISTGGVFDGLKEEPYTELDTPAPVIVYGRTKLAGEQAVQDSLSKFFIVRAGWMIGGGPDRDKKFVRLIFDQIIAGAKDLYAVTDKIGTPTYTKDFCSCLLNLLETDYYGLYHMGSSGKVTRFDVACEIVRLLGWPDITVHPVDSSHFQKEYPAPRPRSEMLQNLALERRGLNSVRPWKDALREYIEEKLAPSIVTEQTTDAS